MSFHWDSIQAEFDEYIQMVFNPEDLPLPAHVYRELRRTFVAGIWMLFNRMLAIQEPDITEEEGARFFARIKRECVEFKEMVTEGKR